MEVKDGRMSANGEQGGDSPSPPEPEGIQDHIRAADEVMNNLDPKFFTKDFDPVRFIFDSLPAEDDEIPQFLQAEIALMEEAMEVVTGKLAESIQENYSDMVQGMRHVEEVDLDISRALIHVKNARRMATSSQQSLVVSNLKILNLNRRHRRMKLLMNSMGQIAHIMRLEREMKSKIAAGDFTDAVLCSVAIVKKLRDVEALQFMALRSHRARFSTMLLDLRQVLDDAMSKLLLKFDSRAYDNLLRAYILLERYAELNRRPEYLSKDRESSTSDLLNNLPELYRSSLEKDMNIQVREVLSNSLSGNLSDDDDDEDHEVPETPKKGSADAVILGGRAGAATTPKELVKQMEISDILALLPPKQLVHCLFHLYNLLSERLYSQYLIGQWHRCPFSPDNTQEDFLHRPGTDFSGSFTDSELFVQHGVDLESLRQRLTAFTGLLSSKRAEIWDKMQRMVANLLNNVKVSSGMKLEPFVSLVMYTYDFVDIGEEFSAAGMSHSLRGCLKLKCQQFLENLHHESFSLIRMLLDTEPWRRIPVRVMGQKELLSLTEKHAGLKRGELQSGQLSSPHIVLRSTSSQGIGLLGLLKRSESTGTFSILSQWPSYGNPFAEESAWVEASFDPSSASPSRGQMRTLWTLYGGEKRHRKLEDASIAEEEEEDEVELASEDGDDVEIRRFGSRHVVTSVALAGFAKHAGRYLKVIEELQPIAGEGLAALMQLFDFFFYSIFTAHIPERVMTSMFASKEVYDSFLGRRHSYSHLRSTILQMMKVLGQGSTTVSASLSPESLVDDSKALPHLIRRASTVKSSSSTSPELHSLDERVIGVETMSFILEIMRCLRPKLEELLPSNQKEICASFYDSRVRAVKELRYCMYRSLAFLLISATEVPSMIEKVNWSAENISGAQNAYVITLVQRCGDIWGKLQGLVERGDMQALVAEEIWKQMVRSIAENMVEGFSRIKKCSNEGRTQMSIDLQALQAGLALINRTESRTLQACRDYADNFVKAFYLPKEDLYSWIKAHAMDYELQHMQALVLQGQGGRGAAKEMLQKVDVVYEAVARIHIRADAS